MPTATGAVNIRVALESDIQAIKSRLREKDAQEVLAYGFDGNESALATSFHSSSLRYTVELEGVPVAMFGTSVDSIVGYSAQVWFLGTPEMARIKKTFVKVSRQMIAFFLTRYPHIWNVVDVRYIETLRWLKSCGAKLGDPVSIGGPVFIPFSIVRRS